MNVPMKIYIDRDGEPVRQPSATEAERMGFRQIEVTPTEVAVASLAAQRQFHHDTLDERDRLKAERDRVANELIRLRLITEDDPETIYHEAKQYRDVLQKLCEVPVCRNEAVQLALLEVSQIAREALGPHWRESPDSLGPPDGRPDNYNPAGQVRE